MYEHICIYICKHNMMGFPPQIFDHAEGYASYERAYQHKVPPNPQPHTLHPKPEALCMYVYECERECV